MVSPYCVGSFLTKLLNSVFWEREVEPLSLVDEALSRCASGDDALASWLFGLQDGDRSQLRSDVNNRVGTFLESWPR